MIGNDLIDLNVAGGNSRWQEQRFLDKLFTQEEQTFILKDDLRYQNIWLLWSMKESAYKIYSRKLKSSRFNPKFFSCTMTSETTGMVSFDNQVVNTTTEFDSNIIYTTAHLQDTLRITKNIVLTGQSQSDKSQLLKEKAIQAFAELKNVLESSISIEKNNFGIPELFVNKKLQYNVLTLTHHGNYGGFAISY